MHRSVTSAQNIEHAPSKLRHVQLQCHAPMQQPQPSYEQANVNIFIYIYIFRHYKVASLRQYATAATTTIKLLLRKLLEATQKEPR